MVESCFVTAETKRIELSNGHWIEVKAELSYGEEQELFGAGFTHMNQAVEFSVDLKRVSIAKLATWIVDWSFVDGNGNVLAVTPENIARLKGRLAREVEEALDRHVAEVEAAEANPPQPAESGTS